MAIQKQTLHPQGRLDIDIYPKTSVDQVEGLEDIQVIRNSISENSDEIIYLINVTDKLTTDVEGNMVSIETLQQSVENIINSLPSYLLKTDADLQYVKNMNNGVDYRVYVAAPNDNRVVPYTFLNSPETIVSRDNSGNFRCNYPIDLYDCVPLIYLDDFYYNIIIIECDNTRIELSIVERGIIEYNYNILYSYLENNGFTNRDNVYPSNIILFDTLNGVKPISGLYVENGFISFMVFNGVIYEKFNVIGDATFHTKNNKLLPR